MKLTRINSLLLAAIILINGYIVALPFIPGLVFWIQKQDGGYTRELEAKVHRKLANSSQATPQEQRLTIPSMQLDEPVFEGASARTLRKGLWHRPQTSAPDKGGNTVIVGHRLTYTNPRGTLYHLDKVRTGDDIGLTWNGRQYVYTVTSIKVVGATEISVEEPTDEPRLTIYTCTPLWLPKDRLVVTAELQEVL